MNKFKTKLAAFFRGEGFTGGTITAIVIAAVIAFNVIVYALTLKFGLYLYKPEAVDLTISGSTDSLFADAIDKGEKVTVIFCRAEDDMVLDEIGYFHETAKQFAERYPEFISIEYVNIITKRNSAGELVDLARYQQTDAEGNLVPLYKSSVIFESRTQHKTVIDIISSTFTYDSTSSSYQSYNGEEVFASMVSWVLTDEHKTAYFTTYHGEAVDFGFANMLACAGYSVEAIDLRKNEIPDDAGLVIISNPVKDFERAAEGATHIRSEIERLRSYMDRGGCVYVAIDPYSEKLHVLESFIAEYGIEIPSVEKNGKDYRYIVKDTSNAITADSFTIVTELAENGTGSALGEKMAQYTDSSVIVKDVAMLELSGSATEIFVTSGSSSIYTGSEVVNSDGGYCVGAVSVSDADDGKKSTIFVVPSIYLTANDAVVTTGYANRDFLYVMIEDLFGANSVPHGCNTVYTVTSMLENLTMGTARTITALLLAIPAVIAVIGAVVVIRRKNR